MKRLSENFFSATRANFLPASIIPFLIGVSFSRSCGYSVSPVRLVLGLAGIVCAHLAGNVMNDYFDHKSGADDASVGKSPFFGGSGVIQEGRVKAEEVLRLGVFFLAVSFCCGIFIFAITKNPVFLMLMLAAGILTVEYTAPPLRLAYRRLGEAVIFILFGVLMVMGSFYLFAETFTFGSFLISLPIAFLVSDVLVCNEMPDFPGDMAAGKMNLVSAVGQRAGYLLYSGILALSILCIIGNILFGYLPPIALGLLLFYFPGFKAAVILKDRFKDLESSVKASRMTISMHGAVGFLTAVILFFRR